MEFDSKIYVSNVNPIVGDKIKTEIDETHQSYLFLDKDEVKQEFVEDSIKTEGIIDDDCVSFNTDMSLCIEERVPVNISYCDYCNYGTNDKQNHIFTHSMSTTHTHNVTLMCNVCNFTCVGSDVLNEHMSAHTPNFNCDKCDYETFGKNHKTVHSERKPYKCSLCAYSSNYPGYLKLHFKRHSGEGSLSCDKCDYKGYSKNLLKLHKTVHSERKSFQCDLCDYITKYPFNLKVHSKVHFGERNFNCDYKAYTKNHLTRHKMVRSEQKIFKCCSCNFSTKYRNALKKHLKLHSGVRKTYSGGFNNFSCDMCEYTRVHSHPVAKPQKSSFDKKNVC